MIVLQLVGPPLFTLGAELLVLRPALNAPPQTAAVVVGLVWVVAKQQTLRAELATELNLALFAVLLRLLLVFADAAPNLPNCLWVQLLIRTLESALLHILLSVGVAQAAGELFVTAGG